MRVALAFLEAKPGEEDTVARALGELVEATSQETGVVTYVVHRDGARRARFVVYERYVDAAALDRHMAAPWLATALAALAPRLASPPVVERLDELAAFDGRGPERAR